MSKSREQKRSLSATPSMVISSGRRDRFEELMAEENRVFNFSDDRAKFSDALMELSETPSITEALIQLLEDDEEGGDRENEASMSLGSNIDGEDEDEQVRVLNDYMASTVSDRLKKAIYDAHTLRFNGSFNPKKFVLANRHEVPVNSKGLPGSAVHIGEIVVPSITLAQAACDEFPELTDIIANWLVILNHFNWTTSIENPSDMLRLIENARCYELLENSDVEAISFTCNGKLRYLSKHATQFPPELIKGENPNRLFANKHVQAWSVSMTGYDRGLPRLADEIVTIKVAVSKNEVIAAFNPDTGIIDIPFIESNIERMSVFKRVRKPETRELYSVRPRRRAKIDELPIYDDFIVKEKLAMTADIFKSLKERMSFLAPRDLPMVVEVVLMGERVAFGYGSTYDGASDFKLWDTSLDTSLLGSATLEQLQVQVETLRQACDANLKRKIEMMCRAALDPIREMHDVSVFETMLSIAIEKSKHSIDGFSYSRAKVYLDGVEDGDFPFTLNHFQDVIARSGASDRTTGRREFIETFQQPKSSLLSGISRQDIRRVPPKGPDPFSSEASNSFESPNEVDHPRIETGFKERYLEIARQKKGGKEAQPPWVGLFWNDLHAPIGMKQTPTERGSVRETILVQKLHTLPVASIVEYASEFRPDAQDVLQKWRKAWLKSFPDLDADPRWKGASIRRSMVQWVEETIEHQFSGTLPMKDDLHGLVTLFSQADQHLEHANNDPRDHRLHIVDDADTVLNCAHMLPKSVVLIWSKHAFLYEGNCSDGLPLFSYIGPGKSWMSDRLNDHPAYWHWEPFSKHMMRRSLTANTRRIAAAMLADMAWQGETHAFVKVADRKKGTWTIDLSDVKTIKEAEGKLSMLQERDSVVIQEHLPFTHEQRFYVYDGRVFTSVCSDRNFCRLDNRKGKRLDDRLAVLKVPSINHGAYDRGVTSHVVDRKTSAALARKARQIAREMKAHGVLNYCLDLGLTERGIAAVEINTLHYAGPYCMDHAWQAKAYTNARKGILAEVREELRTSDFSLRVDDALIRDGWTQVTDADLLAFMWEAIAGDSRDTWRGGEKLVKKGMVRTLLRNMAMNQTAKAA